MTTGSPCNILGEAFDFEEDFDARRSRGEACAMGMAARFQTIVRIRVHTTVDFRWRIAFRIVIIFRIDFIVCFVIVLSLLEISFGVPPEGETPSSWGGQTDAHFSRICP